MLLQANCGYLDQYFCAKTATFNKHWCAAFINGCLDSDCDVVAFVTRHGVYFRRMLSPIGRNSLFCCRRFGIRLSDIASINRSFVWTHYQSQLTESLRRAVLILLELLFAKLGYFSISCLSHADLTHAVDFICTSWCLLYVLCVFLIFCTLCTIYIINK